MKTVSGDFSATVVGEDTKISFKADVTRKTIDDNAVRKNHNFKINTRFPYHYEKETNKYI